jgi:mono/diheme cytochrome c family protein
MLARSLLLRAAMAAFLCISFATESVPAAAPTAQPAVPPSKTAVNVAFFEEHVQTFLAQHCTSCHGADDPEGQFRLDDLSESFDDRATAERWSKIRERLRDGEMPPPGEPRPDGAVAQAVAAWIARSIDTAPRKPTARRLNRLEHENTLRDLLELPGLQIKERLPVDAELDGFDTVGDALDISYVQMARYLEATDAALEMAISTGLLPLKPQPQKWTLWPQDSGDWGTRAKQGAVIPLDADGPDPLWDRETGHVDKTISLKSKRRVRAMATFFHADPAGNLKFPRLPIPHAGMYRLRVSTFNFEWNKGEYLPSIRSQPFALGTETRVFGYYDSPPNEAAVVTIETWLEPQDLLHFNPVGLKHGVAFREKGASEWSGPGVAVESIEIEGPLVGRWPSAGRLRLFGDLGLQEWQKFMNVPRPPRDGKISTVYTPVPRDVEADTARLLKEFMTRAFRRPAVEAEVERYQALVRSKLAEGTSYEEAMRFAAKAILCSPDFLFLRTDPKAKADAYAIAERLSYFLWKSLPDEELTRAASTRSILKPEGLRSQVERMLNDPKSARFVNDFCDQWLKLRDINATQPDRALYPDAVLEADIAPYLIDSMRDETRAFVTELLREDLSVTHLVDSDFAMLNEPLATLYGIEGLQGTAIRKFPLPSACGRGGLLTQAAVLKVTANGTTTSPVTRGAWVSTRLLGRTLPPPPEVEAIDPDVRGATTIREQLDKHRNNESCSVCHRHIDPPGFALESFDVVGGRRDRYRALVDNKMTREGPAVDPSGRTVDGREFRDMAEFKKLLLADPDRLARNLAAKLLTYAVGRSLTPADKLEIDAIVERTRGTKFGVRSLLHEVVQTRAFRGTE